MSDAKTKKYVVVFDQLDANTGEFANTGPGQPPRAITKSYFRGDTVELDAETAQRHLDTGAVLPADDRRAKLVKPNPQLGGGVTRDVDVALSPYADLEVTEPAVAGGTGARRTTGGKLGTKAELSQLKVGELKQLAAEHGVTVERGDNKRTLAGKLAKVRVGAAAADDAALNPGQEKDQSPPPVDQPDEPPAEK